MKILNWNNFILESKIHDLEIIFGDIDSKINTILKPFLNNILPILEKIKKEEGLNKSETNIIKSIFYKFFDKRNKNSYKHNYEFPKILNEFTNFFMYSTEKTIDIGFFYDSAENSNLAVALIENENYGILCINLAKLNKNVLHIINNTIKHELVHFIDPKVRNINLYNKLATQKLDTLDNYYKLPYEFDAYSYEIINTIKNNRKYLNDIIVEDIWNIIKDLKTDSIDSVVNKYKNNEAIKMFIYDNSMSNDDLIECFKSIIEPIKYWWTKPTMIKTFYKRLANVLI